VNAPDLYNANAVRSLFDEMSQTYGWTNMISSFGFSKRWREQCVGQALIEPGMRVYDLMTGMGECWGAIGRRLDGRGALVALDFSAQMCRRARTHMPRLQPLAVQVVEEDVLLNTLADESADRVLSNFGLKTFSDPQQELLAREIERILRPGGMFSLIEISVPPGLLLRLLYLFYLKRIIPIIGKLMLGNPDNYRMLGIYTEQFGNCTRMGEHLRAAGLEVEDRRYFYGCASGLVGRKACA
jgi:demethylmenaquinone methyltransferase/2-methoxy-6-polyprenyl-1,4-benzoquinol methylase